MYTEGDLGQFILTNIGSLIC